MGKYKKCIEKQISNIYVNAFRVKYVNAYFVCNMTLSIILICDAYILCSHVGANVRAHAS